MPDTHEIYIRIHGGERPERSQYRADKHPWTPTHERTPHEHLRALIRELDPETPTTEINRIVVDRIPGGGPSDEAIVETIREDFEREHAGAHAKQCWAHDDPPTLSILTERTIDRDTGTTVVRADVRAAIEHFCGDRERGCGNTGGVIEWSDPVGPGYRRPDCLQQGLREIGRAHV